MAGFLERNVLLLNDIPKEVLGQVKNYAESIFDEESCGLIVGQEKINFIPCRNLSRNKKNNFYISPADMIRKNIMYIFHSHVGSSSQPSKMDIDNCKNIMIPFLIYSLRDKDFYVYKCV